MLSEYDKKRIIPILNGEGDWFTAILLRFLWAQSATDLQFWGLRYAHEVKLIKSVPCTSVDIKFTPPYLSQIMAKADHFKAQNIAFVLRSMADKLDKRETA